MAPGAHRRGAASLPHRRLGVRAAPPARDRCPGPRRRRGGRRDRAGLLVLLGSVRPTTRASPTPLPAGSRTAPLPRRRRAHEPVAHRCRRRGARGLASSRCSRTRAGVAGRGSPAPRRPTGRAALRRFATALEALGSTSRPAGSGPRWRSSSSTTARSRSGSTPRIDADIGTGRRGDRSVAGSRPAGRPWTTSSP